MGLKDTKIRFTQDDLNFLSNVQLFERKRNMIAKIVEILGELELVFHETAELYSDVIPQKALKKRGKITKGENYKGLPYVILDHPAQFGKEGIFAIRSLVWWGHPVIFTFHISGKYLEANKNHLIQEISKLQNQNLLICINSNEFEHHLEPTNYISLKDFFVAGNSINQLLEKKSFLKMACEVPLKDISELSSLGKKFLIDVFEMLRLSGTYNLT